ncbi:MAG: helix-turn-helix domain-containing protein [Nitrospira sp.]|nr:helix-turn-helix domain-containing protein [Nitrospira sp.]
MESVGEFFRQVRETKKLTVEEVSSKTRIRLDFINALEDENFAKLPDQVFARGFVRSYARSLGLDEEDVIQRFAQSSRSFYEKQDEQERLRARQTEENRKHESNRKTVMVAVGIAVLTLVFLLSREQPSVVKQSSSETASVKDSTQAATETPSPTLRQDLDPVIDMLKPAEGAAVLAPVMETHLPKLPTPPPVASKPVSASEPISRVSPGGDGPLGGISREGELSGADGQLVLDLEATELSWVVVQIDNGRPQEALLRPGEKARWKGQDQFILTLGNAGGVKAELNGKSHKPFGPSGTVVRDIVLKR